MSVAEGWKAWEDRVVDGKFPLRQWLGGSEHSGVFLTQCAGQEPPIAAIKLIATGDVNAELQLAEWRAAGQLSHPSLIRLFEAGRCQSEVTDILYVVTECAEEDLSQILPQRPLTPAEVGDMLPPLLEALSYLHRRGFVHGRLKPSNLQAAGDQLKLSADHIAAPGERPPGRRDIYDAPETAAGVVSPASDIWSLGVTLLAALTQSPSFGKDSRGDPSVAAIVPEPFRGIVRECLHLDPKRRCSLSDITARLQPAARSVPAAPEAPPAPEKGVSRSTVGLAALVLAVLFALVVFYARGKHGTSAPALSAEPRTEQAAPQPAPQAAPQPAPPPAPKPETPKRDARGQVVHQVVPDVPASARNTIQGTIKINVRDNVDSSGRVTKAKLASREKSKYFAKLALEAAHGWEFSPPEVNGKPKPSVWLLRFRFSRSQTLVSPERLRR